MHEQEISLGVDPRARADLDKQVQHVQRVAGFSAEMAATLKVEFEFFWTRPQTRAEVAEAPAFAARIDALAALTDRYLKDAERCLALPPVQATRLLAALDLGKVLEGGRGLEGTARFLRGLPRVQAWARAHGTPLRPPPAPTGGLAAGKRPGATTPLPAQPAAPEPAKPRVVRLTSVLQGWLNQMKVTEVPAEPPPPPPTPEERRVSAADAAVGIVGEVLVEVGPRLEALRLALIGTPSRRELEALTPEMRAAMPALREALQASPQAERAARIAIHHYVAMSREHAELELARDAALVAQDGARARILASYDPAKLKGLVMPLTNLHLTFRDVPALAAHFPAPRHRALVARIPTDGAPAPEPVAEPAVAAPAAPADAEAAPKPAEASKRRLGLIMDYIKNPESHPELRDKQLLYRLIAEERAYQQDQVAHFGLRLRLLPAPQPDEPADLGRRRAETQAAQATARKRQAQLHELLKQVTGASGRPPPRPAGA